MFGRKPTPASPTKFGEVAISMGLIRNADVQKALRIQQHRQATGQPVPLLGEVLEGLGLLSDEQVQDVFGKMLERSDSAPAPRRAKPAPKPTGKPAPKGRTPAAADTWWSRLRRLAAG